MRRIDHPTRQAAAEALADRVAADLSAAVAARGRASLAVPGGTTPAAFLAALGKRELPWERIAVTLTDERRVPPESDRSNARLLAETLFAGPAVRATFVPLEADGDDVDGGLGDLAAILSRTVLPLDVVVLGMGADGHVASLFPGGDRLRRALSPDAPPVLSMAAPGADEPRLTLTLPALAAARRAYLLIAGAEKAETLATALGPGPAQRLPVRAVLAAHPDLEVFFAD